MARSVVGTFVVLWLFVSLGAALSAEPGVRITSPGDGVTIVSGDPLAVELELDAPLRDMPVTVYRDGKPILMTNKGPYALTCETSGWGPGEHVLKAVVLVSGGEVESAEVRVIVAEGEGTGRAGGEAGPDDWLMPHGDAGRTNVGCSLSLPLELRWKVERDPVHVAVEATLYASGRDGLYALDAYTGEAKWRCELPASWWSAAYGQGIVCGASFDSFAKPEPFLWGIDIASREVKWRVPVAGRVSRPLLAANGIVYASAWDDTEAGTNLYAVGIDSGRLLWSRSTGGPYTTAGSGGRVFTSEQGRLVCMDGANGDLVWRGDPGSGSSSPNQLTILGQRIFQPVGGRRHGGFISAREVDSGEEKWRYSVAPAPPPAGREGTTKSDYLLGCAVAEEVLVFGDWNGRVTALNPEDGTEKWIYEARSPISEPPLIAGGLTFVGTDDGRLVGLDLASGREVWRYQMGDRLRAPLVASQGSLYASSDDGFVYAFSSGKAPTLEPRRPAEVSSELVTVKPPRRRAGLMSPEALEGEFSVEVAAVTIVGGIVNVDELAVRAEAGAEYVIEVKAAYRAKDTAKLAANIKPDVRERSREVMERGGVDVYNATVHFDTQTRPGYSDVKGEGELTFSLKSSAPQEPGRYEKALHIGLFKPVGWATIMAVEYPFVLVVE